MNDDEVSIDDGDNDDKMGTQVRILIINLRAFLFADFWKCF